MSDPEVLKVLRRWLRYAEDDLRTAETLLEQSDIVPRISCFHAQQAAEKALKAVLYGAGERVVIGHSLAELGERVEQRDPAYRALRGEVAKLDRYYVPTRYPNGLPAGGDPGEAFDAEDAAAAIATAERALEYVRRLLDA